MKTRQVNFSKSNQGANSSNSNLNSKNIFYRFFQFSNGNNQNQSVVVSPHFNNDTFVALNGSYNKNKNGTSNSVSNNNKSTKKGKFKKVLSSMSTGVKVLVVASALYFSTLGCS